MGQEWGSVQVPSQKDIPKLASTGHPMMLSVLASHGKGTRTFSWDGELWCGLKKIFQSWLAQGTP